MQEAMTTCFQLAVCSASISFAVAIPVIVFLVVRSIMEGE